MTDENLPIPTNEFMQQLGIVLPPPIVIDETANFDLTKKADMQMCNACLRVLYAMWAEVRSFNQALTMVDKTFSFIEKRRLILGHPYGPPSDKAPKGSMFEHIP